LSLFAAGIVLFVLLLASYSGRGTWIALGSMTMSMALLFGCLLLATSHDRRGIRTNLAWVAHEFPLLLDRQTAEQLAASLERLKAPSLCGAGQLGCAPEIAPAQPLAEPLAERETVQAAATAPGWFDTNPDPKTNSQSPVTWQLDVRDVQPVTSPWGFSIHGTNVSDQTLEQVQAVLKPDSAKGEVPLGLSVEGGDGSVIPADARFSLFSAAPEEDASGRIGGAILTFRYVQAGQRKSSILYLTPAMVARLAGGG
jgi:hypothetical protein